MNHRRALISTRSNSYAWLMLAGMIVLMTSAQVLFKFAGIHAHSQPGWIDAFVLNLSLWMGLIASGAGLLFWLQALRRLALPTAYPWTALIYLLTPLASVFCFDETLRFNYLIGMVLIIAGVFLSAGSLNK